MARLRPKESTVKRLFSLSGNRCAFPGCKRTLVIENGVVTGIICHIKGTELGAARYDEKQTDEDRRAFENLLLMCGDHHKEIDTNREAWPVERLEKVKREHEAVMGRRPAAQLTDDQVRQFQVTINVVVNAHQLAAAGDGSVVIQVEGDRNTVLVGGDQFLTIRTPAMRRQAIEGALAESDLLLLRADMPVTEHVGVDSLREDFCQWAKTGADGSPLSLRVLTGPAGAGKTRFALELLAALDANRQNEAGPVADGGWVGGFVDLSLIARFDLSSGLTQITWPASTLLVVDYAETGGELMKAWLTYLAERLSPDSAPVRVLLLARAAEMGEGWLAGLQAYSSDTMPGLRSRFDRPEPIPLPLLTRPTHRRQVLQATLDAYAERKGLNVPPLPAPGENEWFDKRLEHPQWGVPLCLLMAAAVACRSDAAEPVVTALSMSRTDLAIALAEREKTRLRRGLPDNDPRRHLRPYLAACATIARGLDEDEAVRAADTVIEHSGLSYPGNGNALAHDLRAHLAAAPGGIAPVEPDIIGEAFVYLALRARADGEIPLGRDHISAILLALFARIQREEGGEIRLLMHLIQDFADKWEDLLDWLDDLIPKCLDEHFSVLLRIANSLPQQTLVLMEKSREIHQAILNRLDSVHSPSNRLAHLSCLGAAEHSLAATLSDLGKQKEAYQHAQKAVAIHRAMSGSQPAAPQFGLAMSLNLLATVLRELGRREEALCSARQALTLYRALAERDPSVFRPYLASCLNNLVAMLSDLGLWEEALQVGKEAVLISEGLPREPLDAHLRDLAISKHNLSIVLAELGRRKEGHQHAREAAGILCDLGERRPDSYTARMGTSLATLANRLSNLGQGEDARRSATLAVRVFRSLSKKHPDRFRPNLATSLNNSAGVLLGLGQPQQALPNAQEAVAIQRCLAEQRPHSFPPHLAKSLGMLHLCHRALGQEAEAQAAIVEAMELIVRLFDERPRAYADTAANIARAYVDCCHDAGTPVNRKWLDRIFAAFAELGHQVDDLGPGARKPMAPV